MASQNLLKVTLTSMIIKRAPIPPAFSALATLVIGSTIYYGLENILSNFDRFFMLTLLLILYLYGEIQRIRYMNSDRWLLNPAVLCSITTFILAFGIGNFIYLLPDESTTMVGIYSFISPAMVKIMMLSLVAATSMWAGYWSRLANSLGNFMTYNPLVIRVNNAQFILKPNAVVIFLLIILLVRLRMIQLGIYGYSSDATKLADTTSFRQYLTILDSLGKLTLTALSLHYFSNDRQKKSISYLFAGSFLLEMTFGILSGFKSAIIMPVIIVGICYYYKNNLLPSKQILITIFLIPLTYSIVEPFRAARYDTKTFDSTSIVSISSTMLKAAASSASNTSSESSSPIFLAFLARHSLSYIASLGIEYKDSKELPENSPNFIQDIFLSPLYAVIPRALWSSKEMSRHGQWYVQEIMGFSDNITTSVGMSPITYLYFAGEWLAVCLGFFFVGLVYRIITLTLFEQSGIIYLAILPYIATVDSVYYSFILDTIRMIPILIIYFVFVYKRAGFIQEAQLQ